MLAWLRTLAHTTVRSHCRAHHRREAPPRGGGEEQCLTASTKSPMPRRPLRCMCMQTGCLLFLPQRASRAHSAFDFAALARARLRALRAGHSSRGYEGAAQRTPARRLLSPRSPPQTPPEHDGDPQTPARTRHPSTTATVSSSGGVAVRRMSSVEQAEAPRSAPDRAAGRFRRAGRESAVTVGGQRDAERCLGIHRCCDGTQLPRLVVRYKKLRCLALRKLSGNFGIFFCEMKRRPIATLPRRKFLF